ncbi:hypothetical protein QG37_05863 [Candidozyma auris]|uniref:Uncharacterized protein n=1 Tax=Candidozyma auris TaxID=498019 RepID=A0A0L0NTH6_CANAR|nr:hypothetical protein QG37_05863 [[Candida] auris]
MKVSDFEMSPRQEPQFLLMPRYESRVEPRPARSATSPPGESLTCLARSTRLGKKAVWRREGRQRSTLQGEGDEIMTEVDEAIMKRQFREL